MHYNLLTGALLAILTSTTTASPVKPPSSSSLRSRDTTTETDTPSCPYRPSSPSYCSGTAYNSSATHLYPCGDSRLGPRKLPGGRRDPLDAIMDSYDRFAGLCPGAFLSQWYNETATPRPSWLWPAQDGFSLASMLDSPVATAPKPIKANFTLGEGVLVDRFGGETGTFVSPAGSPYMQRALPPSSLVTYDAKYPFNYHLYVVKQAFVVQSGPVAPWFGQPGQGVQYELYSPVATLIEGGFLERVEPDEEE